MTVSIWLIILSFGAATYAMRGAFLFRARRLGRAPGAQRWLRFVPPALLAALVAPALVGGGNPLALGTLAHVLAAGLAALVAWRSKNVLLTVATGMIVLWLLQVVL